LHFERDRADELNLEVCAGHAQAVISGAQQYVRQHGHRLTTLDDTDHMLNRTEDLFAGGCEFHKFFI